MWEALKSAKKMSLRRSVACLPFLALAVSGCTTLAAEEGRLPQAMRGAIATFTAKGYPDLSKIPDVPQDVPSENNWSNLEAGLVQQGKAVSASPLASAPTPEETNQTWADGARASLETDPRAQPLSPPQPGTPSEAEWAAQAKAKLDADLARLPPP
jgi:hypothetical protein